ncbi:MAG: hypothetical protein AAFP81_06470 [Pseudomonadota bacterium]
MQKRRAFGQRKSQTRTIGLRANEVDWQTPSFLDQRRSERRPLWCETYVYNDHTGQTDPGNVKQSVLLDLNDYGLRVRFRSRALCSQRVFVTVARLGIRRSGRVVWQQGFDTGIEFV